MSGLNERNKHDSISTRCTPGSVTRSSSLPMHYMEKLSYLYTADEPGLIVHCDLTHVKEGALFLTHL